MKELSHKIGDKVRIIACNHGHGFEIGQEIVIDDVEIHPKGSTTYVSNDSGKLVAPYYFTHKECVKV